MKKLNATILYLLCFLLHACIIDDKNETELPSTHITLKVMTVTGNSPSTDSETTSFSKLTGYLFKDSLLLKIYQDIALESDGKISLDVPHPDNLKLYLLADAILSQDCVEENSSTEADFLNLTTQHLVPPTSPVTNRASESPAETNIFPRQFFSGMHVINPTNATSFNPFVLTRSIGRVDIDASADPLILVDSLHLTPVPTYTNLIKQADKTSVSATGLLYKKFDSPLTGKQTDVAQLYETDQPVTATIYARYNNIPVQITTTFPLVKRDYIYTITLRPGTTLKGETSVTPWKDGDITEGIPDISQKIKIDLLQSFFPENVQADAALNTIRISERGGTFEVGFNLPAVDVFEETTHPGAQIDKSGDNRLRFQIAPRAHGDEEYKVKIRLKSPLTSYFYDSLTVTVAARPYIIPTVKMAGDEWMAFNSYGKGNPGQVYLPFDTEPESLYLNHWEEVMGMFFQWGRREAYAPWDSNITNGSGGNKGSIWNEEQVLPCPDGFHIPSEEEWRKLFPVGVICPGTISINGETITQSIVNANPLNITIHSITGTARLLKMVSSNGNVLYFPLAGQKGDKAYSSNPNFGKGVHYWTNKETGYGYAIPTSYWPGNGNTAVPNYSRKPREGYCYVRCIKN